MWSVQRKAYMLGAISHLKPQTSVLDAPRNFQRHSTSSHNVGKTRTATRHENVYSRLTASSRGTVSSWVPIDEDMLERK
eukprot:2022964-Amphidinium_carterae.1